MSTRAEPREPRTVRDRLFDKYAGTAGPWKNVRADMLDLIREQDEADEARQRVVDAARRYVAAEKARPTVGVAAAFDDLRAAIAALGEPG